MAKFNLIPASKQINGSSVAAVFGGQKNIVTLPNGINTIALKNLTGNWASSMTIDLSLDLDFELNHMITESNWNNNSLRCMFGISVTKTPFTEVPTYNSLRNSIYIESRTDIEIYECGVKVFDGLGLLCNIGDVFTVRSVNGRISYLRNNIEFYKSNMAPINTGWIPTVCCGDNGEYNIFGGDKINVFQSGHFTNDATIIKHKYFNTLAAGTENFRYSKNLLLNGKLKINGLPCGNISRKGYRPNASCSRWSAIARDGTFNLVKEANGELKVNSAIIASAESDIKSFYVLCVGGGGGGGKATCSWLDAKSGGGGGSGAFFWLNVTLTPDFVGQIARIDIGKSDNHGGIVYYNWRNEFDNLIKASAGGKGGDGAGGGSGAGSAGIIEYMGNFKNDSINEVIVLTQGNGKSGRPTRPKDTANNSDMELTTLNVYMPEVLTKTIGNFKSGAVGGQNEAGSGAGGYMGAGGCGGDSKGDGKSGGEGGISAGSGGADAAFNYNSGSTVGGPAYIEIFF